MQAEKTKQESRNKDESVRKLEEKLQAAEAKLKAKEQTCQALSEKVGASVSIAEAYPRIWGNHLWLEVRQGSSF